VGGVNNLLCGTKLLIYFTGGAPGACCIGFWCENLERTAYTQKVFVCGAFNGLLKQLFGSNNSTSAIFASPQQLLREWAAVRAICVRK
jgi:hypothetical protein